MSCLPTIGELVNLRVLLSVLISFRFSRWAYYRKFIEQSGAGVVVVWQDTLSEAYLLGKYVNTPIALIQNGLRHNYSPLEGAGLLEELAVLKNLSPAVDRYFVFGEPTIQRMTGYVTAQFVTTGSWRLNEYSVARETHVPNRSSHKPSLGFIVSFPHGAEVPGSYIADNENLYARIDGQSISYSDWYSSEAMVAQSLADVCRDHSIELSIIGKRSALDSIEKNFFLGIDGMRDVPVIPHEKGHGYEVADSFDYLVTVDSTLGYEMLALGHKVAFVSNRFRMAGINSDEMTFAHPLDLGKDGPFWTSATTLEGITEFFHQFLSLTDDDWTKIRQSYVPRLMALDPGNTKLRAYIDEVLAQNP